MGDVNVGAGRGRVQLDSAKTRALGCVMDTVLDRTWTTETFLACDGKVAYQLTFLPAVPGSDLSLELGLYNRK